MRPPHCAGEITARGGRKVDRASGFNEAPALRGGNPRIELPHRLLPLASMRPPHCAGEIGGVAEFRVPRGQASMRPPHCAGEIVAKLRDDVDGHELQ